MTAPWDGLTPDDHRALRDLGRALVHEGIRRVRGEPADVAQVHDLLQRVRDVVPALVDRDDAEIKHLLLDYIRDDVLLRYDPPSRPARS